MRPSKKKEILAAASRIVQRHGVAAVTYDSIAAESGITKGGLVYHFPSREQLISSLHEHLAEQWEEGMCAATDGSADGASQVERLQGYIRAASLSATRAELLFLLEGSTTPEHAAIWEAALARWTPPVPDEEAEAAAMGLFVARLAADGLWVHESLSSTPLDPEFRRRVADHIAHLIAP